MRQHKAIGAVVGGFKVVGVTRAGVTAQVAQWWKAQKSQGKKDKSDQI